MHQPRDTWTVYGNFLAHGSVSHRRVAHDYTEEEAAWRDAIQTRLEARVCNIVIVHTTYRAHRQIKGNWRPVNTVIWRCGYGQAWFEPHPPKEKA